MTLNWCLLFFIGATFLGCVESSTKSELAGASARLLVGIAAILFLVFLVQGLGKGAH